MEKKHYYPSRFCQTCGCETKDLKKKLLFKKYISKDKTSKRKEIEEFIMVCNDCYKK